MRLAEDATDDQITSEILKKKYRKLSFELHPDYNKQPDAPDQFLKLTACYNFLLGYVPFSVKQDDITRLRTEMEDIMDLMRRRMQEENARQRQQTSQNYTNSSYAQQSRRQTRNTQQRNSYYQQKQNAYNNTNKNYYSGKPEWRKSSAGNDYVRKNNLTFIIFADRYTGKYKYCIKNADDATTVWRNDLFDSLDEAKTFIEKTHLQK